jgi:2-(1,2-epoxy-1,2-dihydrophenyl)acetyl-CoA isomerase
MTISFPSAEHLGASLVDDVLTVTIRNPGWRNALDDAALAAFVATVERAQNTEAVRALLITGDGPQRL